MRPALRTAGRAAAIFSVLLALAILQPDPLLRLIAWISAPIVDAATPWAQSVSIGIVDHIFVVSGTLVFDGVLIDGRTMPPIPGVWRQSGLVYLTILPVAVAAWAIPSVSWRRRLSALPIALGFALALAALSLTVEVQRAALQSISAGALADIPLADIPRNRDLLAYLERQWITMRWIAAFLDAGGRLALALMTGLGSVLVIPAGARERAARPPSAP